MPIPETFVLAGENRSEKAADHRDRPAGRQWRQYRRFEIPAPVAANSSSGISNRKRYWNHRVASVPLIPKFASRVAAKTCELRNRDTSGYAPPLTTGGSTQPTLPSVLR